MNPFQSHKFYNDMSNERIEKKYTVQWKKNAMQYNETTKCTVYEPVSALLASK